MKISFSGSFLLNQWVFTKKFYYILVKITLTTFGQNGNVDWLKEIVCWLRGPMPFSVLLEKFWVFWDIFEESKRERDWKIERPSSWFQKFSSSANIWIWVARRRTSKVLLIVRDSESCNWKSSFGALVFILRSAWSIFMPCFEFLLLFLTICYNQCPQKSLEFMLDYSGKFATKTFVRRCCGVVAVSWRWLQYLISSSFILEMAWYDAAIRRSVIRSLLKTF